MYYDVVVQVEPKRNALREATDTLNAANTKPAEVKELVQTLESNLAALQLGMGFMGFSHRKTMGKWENPRKTIGKSWEKPRHQGITIGKP